MMNDQAREIFSKLLDANYDYGQLDEAMSSGEKVDILEMMALGTKVCELKMEFKQAMGVDAYNEFMRQGAEMFAPAR
jgi:hypothetical protein